MFTGAPLQMPAGQFGVGPRRRRARAQRMVPDRSSNPKVAGFDGQALLYADFLYEVAGAAAKRNASRAVRRRRARRAGLGATALQQLSPSSLALAGGFFGLAQFAAALFVGFGLAGGGGIDALRRRP